MIINDLSRFLVDLKYENIPKDAKSKVKLCFLDYLAVYNRGLKTENSKRALSTILSLYPNELDMLNRGLISGIASHSLDLDDGHRLAHLHPGTVVFSTVLAIVCDDILKGSGLNVTTKQFFEAVVGAYEVAIVLGKMLNPDHRNKGFHSTGTIGTIAAAACASKLLDLNLEDTINCLGLATTQSAGLLEADHAGTMGKTLHAGKAVYNGLLSAFLAKNGFTGGESIFDGEEGFIKAMMDETDFVYQDVVEEFLEENLGRFHIRSVYLKKYPFCRHIHSAIDSTLFLKKYLDNLHLDIEVIKEIKVETYQIASEHDNFNPTNMEELKQSLPLAVAIALVCDNLGLDVIEELIDCGLFEEADNFISLDERSIEVRKIRDVLSRITIYYNNVLDDMTPDKRPSKVSFILDESFDKDVLTHTTMYPLGESENPLDYEDILEKFKSLNPHYDLERLKIIEDMEYFSLNNIFSTIGLI